jgi:hypothetical protein
MPAALVTLPDGQRARVTFTDPAQLNATVTDLAKQHPSKQQREQQWQANDPLHKLGENATGAIAEPAVQAVSGLAGQAAGGLRGIYDLATGKGADKATADIQSTEQALTYQPRTAAGKAVSHVIQAPFTLLARGADAAGGAAARGTTAGLRDLGVSDDTAIKAGAGVGAAVSTGIQAAPAALIPAARGVTNLVRGARVPPAAAAEAMTATGAPRAAPSTVGEEVPQGTSPPPSQTAPGAPGAAQPPPAGRPTPETPQTARAQSYARRIGLDWARLGAGTRKALESIAQDAGALERLNPEAVKRQAHLEALRVPVRATRGQLERDPVQLRREALASNTTEGQPIRDTDVAANRDVQANLEVLRGRLAGRRGSYQEPLTPGGEEIPGAVRAPTKAPTQVGEAAQSAVREKAKWSKKGYQALYKLARETEPDAKAPIAPVSSLLESNPEIQHLGWVQGWLSKARSVLKPNEAGETPELTDVTLNELHDLRSKANDIARTGGKEGYYAGQVVKAVDESMEHVPEGAAAWKRANAAFKAHKQEFGEQGLVAKLANQKKGSAADRQLATEKTWKQVATGPVESIRQLKRTLIKGGTPQLRRQGALAWRDLRAETVNRILEDARNVTGADETERNVLTEAALRRSINRIPRENLEELIGKGATRELLDIVRARRITTRSPVGGRTTQSGTVPNALVLAEKVLGHIPGGRYVLGAKHLAKDLGERAEQARAARTANITPLEQAVQDVQRSRPNYAREQRAARRAAAYGQLEQLGPTLPAAPTIGQALNVPRPPQP